MRESQIENKKLDYSKPFEFFAVLHDAIITLQSIVLNQYPDPT